MDLKKVLRRNKKKKIEHRKEGKEKGRIKGQTQKVRKNNGGVKQKERIKRRDKEKTKEERKDR